MRWADSDTVDGRPEAGASAGLLGGISQTGRRGRQSRGDQGLSKGLLAFWAITGGQRGACGLTGQNPRVAILIGLLLNRPRGFQMNVYLDETSWLCTLRAVPKRWHFGPRDSFVKEEEAARPRRKARLGGGRALYLSRGSALHSSSRRGKRGCISKGTVA